MRSFWDARLSLEAWAAIPPDTARTQELNREPVNYLDRRSA